MGSNVCKEAERSPGRRGGCRRSAAGRDRDDGIGLAHLPPAVVVRAARGTYCTQAPG